MVQERQIVLASSSPRRRDLLKKLGLIFKVDPSGFKENIAKDLTPADMAKLISIEKTRIVSPRYPDAIVIAADTFGVLRNKILGKPHTREEAKKMLLIMSGKSHRVITGFTIRDTRNGKTITRTTETRVYFKKLTESEIDHYVNSGEPLDKAGAYAIQGLGAVIVEKIIGDYYNVMGLPLNALVKALKEFGIEVL